VIAVVVGVVILALFFAVVVAIARDRGPCAEDVAISYEHAWDRLDFESLWNLSGAELRDRRDRREFVAAKRAAYATQRELAGLAASVTVEDAAARGDQAVVCTRVGLHNGSSVRNRVRLVRRSSRWQVVAYGLADDAKPHPS
jgi:hypothetical protein